METPDPSPLKTPSSRHLRPDGDRALRDVIDAVAQRLRPEGPTGARQEAVLTVSILMVLVRLAEEDSSFREALDETLADTEGSTCATVFHEWLWSGVIDDLDGGLTAFSESVTVSSDLSTETVYCLFRLPDVWSDLKIDDVRAVLTMLRGQGWSGERMASELTGAMIHAYTVSGMGEYVIPRSLARTMLTLVSDGDLSVLALPGNSVAVCLCEVSRSFKWIETSLSDVRLADLVVRLYFLDGRRGSVHLASPEGLSSRVTGGAFVANPPFGGRFGRIQKDRIGWPEAIKRPEALKSEAVEVVSIASRCVPTAICVPTGFLSNGGETARVREWLVLTRRLVGAIEFPPGMLPNTALACAILVLGPPGTNGGSPRLLDAASVVRRTGRRDARIDDPEALVRAFEGEEHAGATPMTVVEPTATELSEADFALTFARYAKSPLTSLLGDRPTVTLADLVTITRPPPLSRAEEGETDSTIDYREAVLGDFQDDGRLAPHASRTHATNAGNTQRIEAMTLAEGDILLASKSAVGKVALVSADVCERCIPGQTMVRLRLKEQSPLQDPVILLRYLAMPVVREHLEARAGGTAIKALKAKDIAGLPVPVFDHREQERLRQTDRDIVSALAAIGTLRRQVDDMTNHAVRAFDRLEASHIGTVADGDQGQTTR